MRKSSAIFCVFASILFGQTASMPDTVAFVGQTDFKIPIYIEDLVELEGLNISIDYDETVINCESFSQVNTVLENYNVTLNDEPNSGHCVGDVCLSIISIDNFSYSGSGNVIFLECSIEGNDQDYSGLIFSEVRIGSLHLNANHGSVTLINTGCIWMDACNYNEYAVIDDGSCEFESDCAGDCNGSAMEDCAGVCNGSAVVDCTNQCNGSAMEDCAGDCGGSAALDECGTCDNDTSNDCTQDCNGDWGGSSIDDECGVCVGGDTGLTPCEMDCAGFWGGPDNTHDTGDEAAYDLCVSENAPNGICGGDNLTCTDCALVINGTALIDECGYCIDPVCNYLGTPSPFTAGMNPCDGDEFPTSTLWNASCLSIENSILESFSINSIYPNPFNPITTINYSIAIFSEVNISIYSINGKLIQPLVHSSKQPGQYAVQWNASNFPSGLYFVKLISSNKIAKQKILLIK